MSAARYEPTQVEPHPDDPLCALTPLLYCKRFYPYGFPVRVASNSRLVLEAAELSWGHWARRFDAAELEVRCLVAEGDSIACSNTAVYRSQEHLITIVADSENYAVIDLNEGFSFGWVSSATAASSSYFRYMFLDAMMNLQLQIHHVVFVHAACVQFAGRGLLLAGESGAGKSSLSYACARSGWTFLSDDCTGFARRNPSLEALGKPEHFRFRHSAADIFPEIRDFTATRRPTGKPTIEVASTVLESVRTAQSCKVHGLVFLNREGFDGRRPSLTAVPKAEAWRRLSSSLFALQHPAAEERIRALQRLLNLPSFELRYHAFGPAIELLQSFAVRFTP